MMNLLSVLFPSRRLSVTPPIPPKNACDEKVLGQIGWWQYHLQGEFQQVRKGLFGSDCFVTQSGRPIQLRDSSAGKNSPMVEDLHYGDKDLWLHQRDGKPMVTYFHDEYGTKQTDSSHPEIVQAAQNLFAHLREKLNQIQKKATEPG